MIASLCLHESKILPIPVGRPFQTFERQARKRLMVLHAAPSLEALMVNPGNRFHALKGVRKGKFSKSSGNFKKPITV